MDPTYAAAHGSVEPSTHLGRACEPGEVVCTGAATGGVGFVAQNPSTAGPITIEITALTVRALALTTAQRNDG